MEKNYKCIYKIINTKNYKIYIGSSVNYKNRKQEHFRDLFLKKHHSIALQRAYNKYGKEFFKFKIIEYVENKQNIIKREQFYIDKLKPHYNCCKTAGSPLGRKMTEKQKIENSIRNTGDKNSNSKIKDSDIIKILELRKSKTIKEISNIYKVHISTIQRIINKKRKSNISYETNKYKKIYSNQVKEKLSNLRKKNKYSGVYILDKETGVYYYSVKELAILLNINTETLRTRFKSKNNTYKNYIIC